MYLSDTSSQVLPDSGAVSIYTDPNAPPVTDAGISADIADVTVSPSSGPNIGALVILALVLYVLWKAADE